jgi:hypothetical protein
MNVHMLELNSKETNSSIRRERKRKREGGGERERGYPFVDEFIAS